MKRSLPPEELTPNFTTHFTHYKFYRRFFFSPLRFPFCCFLPPPPPPPAITAPAIAARAVAALAAVGW